jgi:hypothetical protein
MFNFMLRIYIAVRKLDAIPMTPIVIIQVHYVPGLGIDCLAWVV